MQTFINSEKKLIIVRNYENKVKLKRIGFETIPNTRGNGYWIYKLEWIKYGKKYDVIYKISTIDVNESIMESDDPNTLEKYEIKKLFKLLKYLGNWNSEIVDLGISYPDFRYAIIPMLEYMVMEDIFEISEYKFEIDYEFLKINENE